MMNILICVYLCESVADFSRELPSLTLGLLKPLQSTMTLLTYVVSLWQPGVKIFSRRQLPASAFCEKLVTYERHWGCSAAKPCPACSQHEPI
jgi:hypothetical protein